MNRYYFSRRKDGLWYTNDRTLGHPIAASTYREQAVLITEALNEQLNRNYLPINQHVSIVTHEAVSGVEVARSERPTGGPNGDREDPLTRNFGRHRD